MFRGGAARRVAVPSPFLPVSAAGAVHPVVRQYRAEHADGRIFQRLKLPPENGLLHPQSIIVAIVISLNLVFISASPHYFNVCHGSGLVSDDDGSSACSREGGKGPGGEGGGSHSLARSEATLPPKSALRIIFLDFAVAAAAAVAASVSCALRQHLLLPPVHASLRVVSRIKRGLSIALASS